ncbi:DNA/RNA-binding domain of Phe-tRNA-synthetase-like protein [Acetoanaerobium pronyense]|uniref:DNA/RNA-binding domain of Phe-tRNA-synthetase-like protein n=1 Tax=Acetoanaerobium pronyense TaxID=1482736 RepID=A0ABS4KGB1_9FIRM|nr:phenylalanine--tRNA ligase beta subunit-related protein [Acetoanaerobium pronyense]MBP2026783.1 DNA/RNA-binding domain of Phe-tRNA-synthetase-like protein [Acetoanaerobium pronyense]
MIKVYINDVLKTALPSIVLGCIKAKVTVKESSLNLWDNIEKEIISIENNYDLSEVLEIHEIKKSREAYKKLGKDPSRYRLSSESLFRRITKGNGLYKVNNIVEINNLISLSSRLPVGTFDIENIDNEIYFTKGKEGEYYDGIGRGPVNLFNLPVFEDSQGKFGSTTSDSTRAMIKETTSEIFMVIISFEGENNMDGHLEHAKNLLREFADGKDIETKIVRG